MKPKDIVNNYISFCWEFKMTASELLEVLNEYASYFEIENIDFGKFVADMEEYTQDNTEYLGFSEVSFEEAMAWFA